MPVTLLYGNKGLWEPWVPQSESCFDSQEQLRDFQGIWHILSSSCGILEQLPWNQHKANDYSISYKAKKTWIARITSDTRKAEVTQ